MPSAILTPRTNNALKTIQTVTYAEFETTSATMVDVPDSAIAIIDLNYCYFVTSHKKTGTATARVQASDPDGSELSQLQNTTSTSFDRKTATSKIREVEGNQTWKLQCRTDVAGQGVAVESDYFKVLQAPLINTQDLFQRAIVTSVKFYGSAEGINNIFGIVGGEDWFTLPLTNQLFTKFIWSANSGNMIWDWGGNEVGVSP